MKGEWVIGSIEELCEIEYGTRVVKKKDAGKIYPVYGGGGATFNMDIYNRQNRMVIARFGMSEQCTRFVKGKFFLNDSGLTILPKNVTAVDNNFLNYQILSLNDLIYSLGRGTAQKNLNVDEFKKIIIGYPNNLKEQQQIVTILDKAFAAIDQAKANIETNIANAEELFQSKLNEVFSHPSTDTGQRRGEGWEEKRLDEVCENLDRKRVPITKSKREAGEIPYYGASGIVDYVKDYLFNEDLLLVSEDGANLLARTYPIAFSVNGKIWVNNHAHVLKFEERTSQYFIEYYLNSISLEPYVSGMAQPKLNQTKLNSITVPFPSITKQQEIVNSLDKLSNNLNNVEKKYSQKISELEDLKKSILQKAFAGELTKGYAIEEELTAMAAEPENDYK